MVLPQRHTVLHDRLQAVVATSIVGSHARHIEDDSHSLCGRGVGRLATMGGKVLVSCRWLGDVKTEKELKSLDKRDIFLHRKGRMHRKNTHGFHEFVLE